MPKNVAATVKKTGLPWQAGFRQVLSRNADGGLGDQEVQGTHGDHQSTPDDRSQENELFGCAPLKPRCVGDGNADQHHEGEEN
jgi:hypothetical protein